MMVWFHFPDVQCPGENVITKLYNIDSYYNWESTYGNDSISANKTEKIKSPRYIYHCSIIRMVCGDRYH